jgi:hypothetical protein
MRISEPVHTAFGPGFRPVSAESFGISSQLPEDGIDPTVVDDAVVVATVGGRLLVPGALLEVVEGGADRPDELQLATISTALSAIPGRNRLMPLPRSLNRYRPSGAPLALVRP